MGQGELVKIEKSIVGDIGGQVGTISLDLRERDFSGKAYHCGVLRRLERVGCVEYSKF